MLEKFDGIVRQASARFTEQAVTFLPGMLAALGLLLAAVVAAAILRLVLVRVLRTVEFDSRLERLGLAAPANWPGSSPSLFIARCVQWIVLVCGLLISLTALDAVIPSRFALSVFQYLPHLLAALLIGIGGLLAARFLARSVLIGAVNMRLHSARVVSIAVKWIVLVTTTAMILDHLGIGGRILPIAFGIVFAGFVLAAALAVGLGSRDAVSRAIDKRLQEPESGNDPLNHV